jgi:hypothetical protein
MLRSTLFWDVTRRGMLFDTDVSGQPIDPTLTYEDGTDSFSRNVGIKYYSTLRNVPEERRCHLDRDAVTHRHSDASDSLVPGTL